jgi:hypothetical protein
LTALRVEHGIPTNGAAQLHAAVRGIRWVNRHFSRTPNPAPSGYPQKKLKRRAVTRYESMTWHIGKLARALHHDYLHSALNKKTTVFGSVKNI